MFRIRKSTMNYQTTRHRWLLAIALTGLMPGGLGIAKTPSPLQRFGRLHGICWGDGYHACQDSGIRPLADLPPAASAGSHHARIGTTNHHTGGTFYDRFDVMNRSNCDSAACHDCPEEVSGLETMSPSVTSGVAQPTLVDQPNPSPTVQLSRTPRSIVPIHPTSKPSYAQGPVPLEMPEVNRPRRLGSASIVANPANVSTESPFNFVDQPAESNSYLGRPTVEMAKRISDSETGFVRQPSYLQ